MELQTYARAESDEASQAVLSVEISPAEPATVVMWLLKAVVRSVT